MQTLTATATVAGTATTAPPAPLLTSSSPYLTTMSRPKSRTGSTLRTLCTTLQAGRAAGKQIDRWLQAPTRVHPASRWPPHCAVMHLKEDLGTTWGYFGYSYETACSLKSYNVYNVFYGPRAHGCLRMELACMVHYVALTDWYTGWHRALNCRPCPPLMPLSVQPATSPRRAPTGKRANSPPEAAPAGPLPEFWAPPLTCARAKVGRPILPSALPPVAVSWVRSKPSSALLARALGKPICDQSTRCGIASSMPAAAVGMLRQRG